MTVLTRSLTILLGLSVLVACTSVPPAKSPSAPSGFLTPQHTGTIGPTQGYETAVVPARWQNLFGPNRRRIPPFKAHRSLGIIL